jgi:hypothetical protein
MALHADDAADRVAQLTTLTRTADRLMRDDLAELEAHRRRAWPAPRSWAARQHCIAMRARASGATLP